MTEENMNETTEAETNGDGGPESAPWFKGPRVRSQPKAPPKPPVATLDQLAEDTPENMLKADARVKAAMFSASEKRKEKEHIRLIRKLGAKIEEYFNEDAPDDKRSELNEMLREVSRYLGRPESERGE